jgi:hypothetical protein
MRENERERETDGHDDGGHTELRPADHGDATLQPTQDRAQLQRESIARDEKECDDGSRERCEHDTGEQNGQHGRPAAEAREPPQKAGKRLNLLYGTQVQTRPPRFRFFVNDPALITRDYGYWVENQLRERFQLEGVPVSIDFVRKS